MTFCVYQNESGQCGHKNVFTPLQIINEHICSICQFQSRQIDQSKLRTQLPIVDPEMLVAHPNYNPSGSQPSLFDMGRTFLSSTARYVMGGAKTVSKEEYDERMAICNSCEHRDGFRCILCTCRLDKKCARSTEECPIKKWLRKE